MSIAPEKNRSVLQLAADEHDKNPDESFARREDAEMPRHEYDDLELRDITSLTLWDFFASLWV